MTANSNNPTPPIIKDLARFHLGNRDAILRLATAKNGLTLAAALVFSAALARNYHKEPLRTGRGFPSLGRPPLQRGNHPMAPGGI